MLNRTRKKHKLFGLDVESPRTPYKIFGFVLCLWLTCWFVVGNVGSLKGWPERGQFGDMFGAVNALFSGLAFAGIIYTILLQREELEAQRHELELTRGEFQKQNETLWLQRFENTFFNLLSSHQRILGTLAIQTNPGTKLMESYTGRGIFDGISGILKASLKVVAVSEAATQEEIERLRPVFMRLCAPFFDTINLYLESLHSIFHYTANSDLIADDERFQYFKFIEAQMSYNERTFLYYYLSLADPEIAGNLLFSFHKLERQTEFITFTQSYFFNPSHSYLRAYWRHFK